MTSRPHDPRKLDVAAAAAESQALEGLWPLAGFERLAEGPDKVEGAGRGGDVHWVARGEQRDVAGAAPEIWLQLAARATIWRECQRCLQPVALQLDVARAFRFVADEATAEALDADSEDDILALPRRLDLHALVEDELLLALPLVPMHVECPQELPRSAGDTPGEDTPAASPKPFAALAGLRRGRPD
ncbi:MAG: DUF177 domain-containing protein [Pseudomonadota bacterium]